MRIGGHTARARRMIGLTPLIDVVFILLVFFMLASSFLDWRAISLSLPTDPGANADRDRLVLIDIAADGALAIDGAPVARAALVQRLAARLAARPREGESPTILIRSADGVPLADSIAVLDDIVEAGGRDVSLARGGAGTR